MKYLLNELIEIKELEPLTSLNFHYQIQELLSVNAAILMLKQLL
jgi:hypothetical protein